MYSCVVLTSSVACSPHASRYLSCYYADTENPYEAEERRRRGIVENRTYPAAGDGYEAPLTLVGMADMFIDNKGYVWNAEVGVLIDKRNRFAGNSRHFVSRQILRSEVDLHLRKQPYFLRRKDRATFNTISSKLCLFGETAQRVSLLRRCESNEFVLHSDNMPSIPRLPATAPSQRVVLSRNLAGKLYLDLERQWPCLTAL